MIFCAVTGPIPSMVSRSVSVAEPRLIGPVAAVAPPAAATPADAPAAAFAGTTTCWPSESRAARLIASRLAPPLAPPGWHPVDPGPAHRAGHVHDDVLARAADAERPATGAGLARPA